MNRWMLSLLLLVWALPACAHSEMGEAHETKRNRASFSVEATREIANDWATARLSVSAEGKDPAVVADEVNTQMAAALTASTHTTLGLADKADRIATYRTRCNVRSAGAPATSPTELTTPITVFSPADRTWFDATI